VRISRLAMLECLSSASYSSCPRQATLEQLFVQDPEVQTFSDAHLEQVERIRADYKEGAPGHLIHDDATTPHLVAFFRRCLEPLVPLGQRLFCSYIEEYFAIALANTRIPALPESLYQEPLMVNRFKIMQNLREAIEDGADRDTIQALADKLGGWETVHSFTDSPTLWQIVKDHFAPKRHKKGE